MAGVYQPQYQKKDTLGKVGALTQIGAGVGQAMAGNPTGAISAVQGVQTLQQKPQQDTSTALARRSNSLQESQDNLNALRNAEQAVAQLPPEQQRPQYAAIIQARKMAEQGVA